MGTLSVFTARPLSRVVSHLFLPCVLAGTPGYMPPEMVQVQDEEDDDAYGLDVDTYMFGLLVSVRCACADDEGCVRCFDHHSHMLFPHEQLCELFINRICMPREFRQQHADTALSVAIRNARPDLRLLPPQLAGLHQLIDCCACTDCRLLE